jgi:hypothetical protein
MTWTRIIAAAAIAETLDRLDPAVNVFATPPESFNPPAYIVGYPRTVAYGQQVFGIDLATIPIMIAVGPNEVDRADAMVNMAKDALTSDPSLGRAVQGLTAPEQSNWRRLNVSGIDVLAVDLVLEITM